MQKMIINVGMDRQRYLFWLKNDLEFTDRSRLLSISHREIIKKTIFKQNVHLISQFQRNLVLGMVIGHTFAVQK